MFSKLGRHLQETFALLREKQTILSNKRKTHFTNVFKKKKEEQKKN